MIRVAAPEDIPELVEIGRRFHERAPVPGECRRGALRDFIGAVIGNGDGIVLVADDGREITGTIGGALSPAPYSRDKIAAELWWWSTGREALALLTMFETWAMGRGAAAVAMTTFRPYERMMTARGYGPPQFTRMKAI